MCASLIRSQGLTSKRQRLRVYIETQQMPIRRASLQNTASVTARAQCAVNVTSTAFGLQCVYNLFVKYGYVVHICRGHVLSPNRAGRPRPYCLDKSNVEKRWLLASVSCN